MVSNAFFAGTIWDYYHWGFYPLLSIFFASLYAKTDKRIFIGLFGIILVIMVYSGNNEVQSKTFSGNDPSSWLVSEQIADYVYEHAGGDFGYYVYSPDEFGYEKKYAMSYVGNSGIYSVKGTLCQKEKITFLIYNPVGDNFFTDPVYWKTKKVDITGKPNLQTTIKNIVIEKYILNQKQINVVSDPNIICNLQFR